MNNNKVITAGLCAGLMASAAQASIVCEQGEPGSHWNVGEVRYLVLGVFEEDPRYDIHNPEILKQIVQDDLPVCTTHVTNLDGIFQPQSDWPTDYNPNISDWDVRRVTSMRATFKDATGFNQDLKSWNTSQVTDMTEMFFGARNFKQVLLEWDVSKVEEYQDFATGSGIEGDEDRLPKFNTEEGMVIAQKTHALPAQSYMGKPATFTYTFLNTTADFTAENLVFEDDFLSLMLQGVSLDYVQSSCINTDHLGPGEYCSWFGSFDPQEIGQQLNIDLALHYDNGAPIHLHDATQVMALQAKVEISQPLPPAMEIGYTYPFAFTFINPYKVDFDQIFFDNHLYPHQGVEIDMINSSCFNLHLLSAYNQCSWHGYFTPQSEEDVLLSSTMHYQQGRPSTVTLHSTFQRPPTMAINEKPGAGPGWVWPEKRFQPYVQADGSACSNILHDNLTGLLWAKDGNASGAIGHAQAVVYVKDLQLCDLHDGWQLPSLHQLSSIINYDDQDSLTPATWLNQAAQGFYGVRDDWYWTAQQGYSENYWSMLHLGEGNLSFSGAQHYVLAMHDKVSHGTADQGAVIPQTNPDSAGAGAWPHPRFIQAHYADGSACPQAVVDQLDGVMWAVDGSYQGTQADALSHVQALTLCGYEDWTLPSLHEMRSMVVYQVNSTPNLWLNEQGFQKMQAAGYWTATPFNAEQMWRVELDSSPEVSTVASSAQQFALPVRHLIAPQ